MAKLKAVAVFTPDSFPTHTYVQREDEALERRLRDALDTPGQIISIAGPSKSGKTVLVEKVVGNQNLIVVTGAGIHQAEEIWERVLDWFEAPSQKTQKTMLGASGKLAAQAKAGGSIFGFGKAEAGGGVEGQLSGGKESSEVYNRRGLSQVVKEIANSDYVVLVDDFHYMSRETQAEAAKQIKEAARLGVKVCVASVAHRSDDMLRANPDLRGRVLSIDLGYWKASDLKRIAILGFEKLNVSIDSGSIDSFVAESAGSPQLMQAICLQACFEFEVREESEPHVAYALTEERRRSVLEKTAARTSFRSLVESLDGGAKTRGTERKTYRFSDGARGDVYRCVLKAISASPPRLSFDYNEISKRVVDVCEDERPVGSSIVSTCAQMHKLAAEKYPNERVLEWDEHKQVLDIPDPYLLFYFRWSGHLNEAD